MFYILWYDVRNPINLGIIQRQQIGINREKSRHIKATLELKSGSRQPPRHRQRVVCTCSGNDGVCDTDVHSLDIFPSSTCCNMPFFNVHLFKTNFLIQVKAS